MVFQSIRKDVRLTGSRPDYFRRRVCVDHGTFRFGEIDCHAHHGYARFALERRILFDEQPVHKLRERQRTELHRDTIGFVFQSYHLIDELSVYENLETPLIYKKMKGKERKERVEAVMERFGMTARRDLFPNQLSGGHQQLVGVARAVMIEPKLILADEPTGNLNSEQGTEVMGLLKELNEEGTTIVQVTHSDQNARYASRIVHLLDGEIEREEKV
jgi:putative ABC transport system ATP-binding protein